NGKSQKPTGVVNVNVQLGPRSFSVDALCLESFPHDFLIGNNTISSTKMSINMQNPQNMYLEFKDSMKRIKIHMLYQKRIKCVLKKTETIKPNSTKKVEIFALHDVIEPNQDINYVFDSHDHLYFKNALKCPSIFFSSNENIRSFFVPVTNYSDYNVTLHKNKKIGSLEQSEAIENYFISNETNKSEKSKNSVDTKIKLICEKIPEKYKNLFTDDETNIGVSNDFEMNIPTTSETPIKLKPYRIPYSQRNTVKDILDKLLECDIIERSCSGYAAPIILVNKKQSNEYRMCVDYRELNK
ncbi:Pol polyprotein-like protein, partial [Dinothrombium tinctorium]